MGLVLLLGKPIPVECRTNGVDFQSPRVMINNSLIHIYVPFSFYRETSSLSLSLSCQHSSQKMSLQIYFCGSVSGSREDASIYAQLIRVLQQYGVVPTALVGAADCQEQGWLCTASK